MTRFPPDRSASDLPPVGGQPPSVTALGTDASWSLVADMGGTNVRLGSLLAGGAITHVRSQRVADHLTVVDAVHAYIAQVRRDCSASESPLPPLGPTHAAFAVAAPAHADHVQLTNGPWSFSRRAVERELGLRSLLVLNDFEALALSVPSLQAHQLRAWGAAAASPQGVLAVVGPGTGLGVACLVQTGQGWRALAGEGGHVTLAATDAFEDALLTHARRADGHVSAETLLSGTGLPVLHRAVAATLGLDTAARSTEQILELGLSRRDAACDRTVDVFCALLGGLAGDVALTCGARGGVYIGGGIVPRLGERFFESAFRQRFEAKGRRSDYMRSIPTVLITDTMTALSGAALALRQRIAAEC